MRRFRYPRLARRAAAPAVRRAAERTMGSAPLPRADNAALQTSPGPPAQELADGVPLILFSYDLPHRQLLHCNQHCHTVLGYPAQALMDLGPDLGPQLLHPNSLAQFRQSDMERRLAQNQTASWTCRVRHADGRWRQLRLRVRASGLDSKGQVREITGSAEDVTRPRTGPIRGLHSPHLPLDRDAREHTTRIRSVTENLTELKNTQQALEKAIATTQADARAKEDFLANMSHEIRTPLHGILGLTGVLMKTTLSRNQHDYLRRLGESAEHLLNVLNDVLITARLGAGKLQPETMSLTPSELLRDCATLLRPRAREKGLRLRIDKPPLTGPVLGDAHRLRQVLLNLVSNAIKFTETGTVRLRCQVVPGPGQHLRPAGTVWLQFIVSDTGRGIAPDTLDKIFEPFTQATASTDREYGGTGLGLSIAEGLVKLMGGALRVCSEVGLGSTFAFTLAFQPVAGASPPLPETLAAAPPLATAGHVLLVEDNLVNSLLAETVLRNWGWQVTTAASGPAAIQLFEHRPFDLVLMDIQMPGMDGETATRALRQHPDPDRAATPVIALTARAQAGEAERLQASGFAGYLAKPYREEHLLETIHVVLARHHPAS